jgi:hypothetical protein
MTRDFDEHLTDDEIIALLHSAADDSQSRHLKNCPRCLAEFEAYRATLEYVNQWAAPERDAAYGRQVWLAVSARLQRRNSLRHFRSPILAWAAVAACGAILFVGLLLKPKPPSEMDVSGLATRTVTPSVDRRLLNAALDDHLERASVSLTSLIHEGPVQFADSRLRAEEEQRLSDLIAENRLYRQTAEQQNDVGAAALLSDVEAVLVDVQHDAIGSSPSELRQMQQRLSDSGLRFRLGVVTSSDELHAAKAVNTKVVGRGL